MPVMGPRFLAKRVEALVAAGDLEKLAELRAAAARHAAACEGRRKELWEHVAALMEAALAGEGLARELRALAGVAGRYPFHEW